MITKYVNPKDEKGGRISSFVRRKNMGRSTLMVVAVPINRNTIGQSTQRSTYNSSWSEWDLMTPDQKISWEAAAKAQSGISNEKFYKVVLEGKRYAIQVNIIRSLMGLDKILTPPVGGVESRVIRSNFLYNKTTGRMFIRCLGEELPDEFIVRYLFAFFDDAPGENVYNRLHNGGYVRVKKNEYIDITEGWFKTRKLPVIIGDVFLSVVYGIYPETFKRTLVEAAIEVVQQRG